MIENRNEQDITRERDVTDETQTYEETTVEEPVEQSSSKDSITFVSMDTNMYYMDKSIVDWESTLQNKQNLEDNMFAVRKILNELMFARHDNASEAIETTFNVVLPFIQEFGFDPTANYKKTYPDCDDYDIALMYCIDAIEIMHTLLQELAVYEANSTLMSSMIQTIIGGNVNESNVQET